MKYNDINKRYTEIVSAYIGNGYTINTSTMGGSQGEIAHIDLTDGKEILRIVIDTFREYGDGWDAEGLEIIVGKCTDKVTPNCSTDYGTVWNSHLEIISTERYYYANRNKTFFVTREEAIQASFICFERWRLKNSRSEIFTPSEKALAIARRYILRKFGRTRINSSKIKLQKYKGKYTVIYNGESYTLK